jgi:hypothetical protein
MITYNNKVLKILNKWLNPISTPVPPSGQWYTLFDGQYGDFTTYDRTNYHKQSTYIETNTSSSSLVYGNISLYKSISIPVERQNDDYLLLEFPFIVWRSSRVESLVLVPYDSSLSLNIDNQIKLDTFMFNLKSLPLTSYRGIYYGVSNWSTTLSIPNISYTETFEHLHPQEPDEVHLRMLVDLHTGRLYFNHWRKEDLPEQIVVTDFIDTQITLNITDNCVISLKAEGYGKDVTPYNQDDYLISGYSSDHTSIKLKSYKGTL